MEDAKTGRDRPAADMRASVARIWRLGLAVLAGAQLAGCGMTYYWQATTGHMALMRAARPVEAVLADPQTAETTRVRVESARRAVDFAHRELLLPDNGSYETYAATGRRYAVWNVIAAPEFSVDARKWCFPVAGCVIYRGYFDETKARALAERLAARGDDTDVGGALAYSTLGRFADPLLDTMMQLPDYRVSGLVFHELSHQRLYIKGDSRFNEGFASFVEQEGIRRWLRDQQDTASLEQYELMLARLAPVLTLFAITREALAELYDQDFDPDRMREDKRDVFLRLRKDYEALRASWSGPPYFDALFDARLNNARLAAMATYDDYVPAFDALLQQQGGNLAAFYARAAEIAALEPGPRALAMADLRSANLQ